MTSFRVLMTLGILAAFGLSGAARAEDQCPAAQSLVDKAIAHYNAVGQATAFADCSRMKLIVTQATKGLSGAKCIEPGQRPPQVKDLTLTEREVVAFRPEGNVILLDPKRIRGREAGSKLADHCYELVIDNKEVSRGVILWTDSPVLTGHATLIVTEGQGGLELQFLSGNHGDYRPILDADLKAVLGGKPRPAGERP